MLRGCISLNPCFNGRYSLRGKELHEQVERVSLNPCFNGRYSLRSWQNAFRSNSLQVLILVLMEDTH